VSVSMYWYKPPSERKELGSSYNLKWPIAKRYGQHDGSCHEEFNLSTDDIPFLEGLELGGNYPEISDLIKAIKQYGSVDVEYK
jgi:hypothetical protein